MSKQVLSYTKWTCNGCGCVEQGNDPPKGWSAIMNHDQPDRHLCTDCVRKQKEELRQMVENLRVDYASTCPECGANDCSCWKKKLDALAAQIWPDKMNPCPICGDHPVVQTGSAGAKVLCPKGCTGTCWYSTAESAIKAWNELITISPAPCNRVVVMWQDGTKGGYASRSIAEEHIQRIDRPVSEIWEAGEQVNTRLFIRHTIKLVRENEP